MYRKSDFFHFENAGLSRLAAFYPAMGTTIDLNFQ